MPITSWASRGRRDVGPVTVLELARAGRAFVGAHPHRASGPFPPPGDGVGAAKGKAGPAQEDTAAPGRTQRGLLMYCLQPAGPFWGEDRDPRPADMGAEWHSLMTVLLLFNKVPIDTVTARALSQGS